MKSIDTRLLLAAAIAAGLASGCAVLGQVVKDPCLIVDPNKPCPPSPPEPTPTPTPVPTPTPTPEPEPTPTPTPTPTPVPTPTPTPVPPPPPVDPPPGVCPFGDPNGASLSHIGIVFRGPAGSVNPQGGKYLGKRYNFDTTPHSKGKEYCQFHRPGQQSCDQLEACQNKEGPFIGLTLPGHFTNDRCDAFSGNAYMCHHKPEGPNGDSGKGAQVGVMTVCATPRGDALPDHSRPMAPAPGPGNQLIPENSPRSRCIKVDVR